MTGHHYVAMNLDKWNSLPAEAQQVIDEVSMECMAKIAPMCNETDKTGQEKGEAAGMEFYAISDAEMARWMDKVSVLQDKWVEERNAEGLDGAAALEYIKSIVEKYNEQYK